MEFWKAVKEVTQHRLNEGRVLKRSSLLHEHHQEVLNCLDALDVLAHISSHCPTLENGRKDAEEWHFGGSADIRSLCRSLRIKAIAKFQQALCSLKQAASSVIRLNGDVYRAYSHSFNLRPRWRKSPLSLDGAITCCEKSGVFAHHVVLKIAGRLVDSLQNIPVTDDNFDLCLKIGSMPKLAQLELKELRFLTQAEYLNMRAARLSSASHQEYYNAALLLAGVPGKNGRMIRARSYTQWAWHASERCRRMSQVAQEFIRRMSGIC